MIVGPTRTSNRGGRATRTRLLETAERLFAAQGIDAVSVTEILEAAGHRNKNAVNYHFGGKDGLTIAIAEYRSEALNMRRTALLADIHAQGREHDLHALSRSLVVPLAELLDDEKNHFLGFLARYHIDRSRRQLVESVDPRVTESYREAFALIRTASGLSRQQLSIRFSIALDMLFTALAGRHAQERSPEGGVTSSRPVFVENLVACVAGCFTTTVRDDIVNCPDSSRPVGAGFAPEPASGTVAR